MTHLGLAEQEVTAGQTVVTDDVRSPPSTRPPVFLHCGWRTRGTWIWNRFRGLPGVRAYYEPLGEPLAQLRSDTVASMHAESWPSGHKGLDRPYFEEFLPLLRRARPGVPGYQPRFATRDFFARPDAELPALRHYLRALVSAARQSGEQPVLKFCRSTGRIGWMRRHFPDAVHVVVMRDPFTQFASALRQYARHGNGHFLRTPLLLLAMNRDLPLIDACARHLGVELPELPGMQAGAAICEAALRAGDVVSWYRAFLAFWVANAATVPDNVQLVIDGDGLARCDDYRRECEVELASLTGCLVDFGDTDGAACTDAPDPPMLRRSEVVRVHAAAELFLASQRGPAWADAPGMDCVARLLAEARAHALGSEAAWRSRGLPTSVPREDEPDFAAALLYASVRSNSAERELAAVLASHSWKVTAPLRWIHQRLGQAP